MKTRNILIAAIVAGLFVMSASPLLAMERAENKGKGHAGMSHASKTDTSKAQTKHAKHMAELKQLLADANAALQAGDSKKAAGLITKAQGMIEKMSTDGVVNNKCPIMGGTINPAKVPANLTRTFNGKKIGFCCAGCPGQWDKLSADAKAKKLHSVMGK